MCSPSICRPQMPGGRSRPNRPNPGREVTSPPPTRLNRRRSHPRSSRRPGVFGVQPGLLVGDDDLRGITGQGPAMANCCFCPLSQYKVVIGLLLSVFTEIALANPLKCPPTWSETITLGAQMVTVQGQGRLRSSLRVDQEDRYQSRRAGNDDPCVVLARSLTIEPDQYHRQTCGPFPDMLIKVDLHRFPRIETNFWDSTLRLQVNHRL